MIRPGVVVLALCCGVACGEDKEPLVTASGPITSDPSDPSDPSSNDPSDPPDEDSGDEGAPTGGEPTSGATSAGETGDEPAPTMRVCELYLDCLSVVSPSQLPEAQQGFGPDGTCWQSSDSSAQQCITACQTALDTLHQIYPEQAVCGLCQLDSDCPADRLCRAGECQPEGCGDGVLDAMEVCDGLESCDPDCQGPDACNPLSLYGCEVNYKCVWDYGPQCIPDDYDVPGDGAACGQSDLACDPGHICAGAEYLPPCAHEGCCTKLCDFTIADSCPKGRECVSLAQEGFFITESTMSYLGLCVPT